MLLLEAGPPFHQLAEVPGLDFLFPGTVYTHNYKTVPQQKSCFSVVGRVSDLSVRTMFGATKNEELRSDE